MATKKKLLQAAAGTAAASGGAGGLNVEQVFSTYVYEGNGSAQNIDNGINLGDNIAGSVDFDGTGDSLKVTGGSFDYSGDLTVEFWVKFDALGSAAQNIFDAREASGVANSFMIGTNSSGKMRLYAQNSGGYIEETSVPSTGVWYHYAVVRSSGTWTMYRDGTSTGTPVSSDTNDYSSGIMSIGQRSFSDGLELDGKLSNLRVVTGTAVYTANFTAPTEPLTNITNTAVLVCTENNLEDEGPDKIAFTVKGNPTPSSESPFSGNTGEGGLVWFKNRDSATNPHQLYDTERGVTKRLKSDSTDPEQTASTGLLSFNSSGFSIGSASTINSNGESIASWTFRKAPKFFDVVTYTGDGTSNRQINHNLGCDVGMLVVKRTDGSNPWAVYHRGSDATAPEDKELKLNQTDKAINGYTTWARTAPTTTDFTVGSEGKVNENGWTYVAYLFAHNDGDGEFGDGTQDIIKCGSYSGNGSSTGPVIDLGFEPQWLLVKDATSANNWLLFDNMRGLVTGGNDALLRPNLADAELTSVDLVEATSTGFRIPTSDAGINGSGNTYIYIAIRRGPMAVPTDATDVFDVSYGTSNGNTPINLGFSTDTMLYKNTSGSDGYISTRLTGSQYMSPNSTAAEATGGDVYWDDMDGISFNNASSFTSWIFYNWKRAPNYFDTVAYTGNGTAGRTVSHNLGVAPEMMWVKTRTGATGRWAVYHKDLGNTDYLFLNETDAAGTFNAWNDTTPTESVFSLSSWSTVNDASRTYIAYLFASVDGVSKVGSYTGNGTSQNIDCGFSSGARFVLIKRTDASGDWGLVDTERGIVAGNDNILYLNLTDAELTGFDVVDPYSSGFTVTSSFNNWNVNGGSYIFYAIA